MPSKKSGINGKENTQKKNGYTLIEIPYTKKSKKAIYNFLDKKLGLTGSNTENAEHILMRPA